MAGASFNAAGGSYGIAGERRTIPASAERDIDALPCRQWLRPAGWLAALAAAGGSDIAGLPSASAQARSAEGLIGALKAARVFDLPSKRPQDLDHRLHALVLKELIRACFSRAEISGLQRDRSSENKGENATATKHGFESRWGHQFFSILPGQILARPITQCRNRAYRRCPVASVADARGSTRSSTSIASRMCAGDRCW
jgi:hypothetical protein